MKKNLYIILGVFLLIISPLFMTSCKDKPKPNPQTTFEQSMTNKDSVAVTGLVNVFFQLAESGRYDEAASMLFKNNVDTVYDEPQPLDNKDMEKVKTLLSSLPIKSHTIDYIKFKEVYENEVKCTAIIMEAHDNIPEVKTVFYFKPVSYLGKWKLCLVDSHHGDQTVIKADKKDSMQNEYQKEMREKNLKELKK
ncbi:MAG: hypothetical protein EGR68_09425 [Prevotella copri]|nr:hypothetical protein [Segatella copri]